VVLRRAPRRFHQTPRHVRIERVAPIRTIHGDGEQALVEFLEDDVVHEFLLSLLLIVFRHSGMVRKHQTRNLEIPGSRSARPGMTSSLRHFFTNGQRDSSSDWNASLPGMVASSL
jgi:hypothetical protein